MKELYITVCANLALCGTLIAAQPETASRLALAPATVKLDSSLANHGVTVRTASSPEFSRMLSAKLGPGTSQSLSPLHPYMLLISNDSAKVITGMLVRYTRRMTNGRMAYSDHPYGSEDLYRQMGIRPGMSVIVAPGTTVMNSLVQVQKARETASLSNVQAQTHLFQTAEFASAIGELRSDLYTDATISVDSVVFEDGTVVGPDVWGTIENHQLRSQVLSEVLFQVQDTKTSDAMLQSWLSSKAGQNFLSSGTLDHYVYNQSELARMAQQAIKLNGRPYAVKLFEAMLKQSQSATLRKES